jgi:hypothetical protein
VYTNRTACVAVWTRPRQCPPLFRDLRSRRLAWKLQCGRYNPWLKSISITLMLFHLARRAGAVTQ